MEKHMPDRNKKTKIAIEKKIEEFGIIFSGLSVRMDRRKPEIKIIARIGMDCGMYILNRLGMYDLFPGADQKRSLLQGNNKPYEQQSDVDCAYNYHYLKALRMQSAVEDCTPAVAAKLWQPPQLDKTKTAIANDVAKEIRGLISQTDVVWVPYLDESAGRAVVNTGWCVWDLRRTGEVYFYTPRQPVYLDPPSGTADPKRDGYSQEKIAAMRNAINRHSNVLKVA
jgi:hypothetical protein